MVMPKRQRAIAPFNTGTRPLKELRAFLSNLFHHGQILITQVTERTIPGRQWSQKLLSLVVKPLARVGGLGLFGEAVEIQGRAQVAQHSLLLVRRKPQ